MIANVVTSVLIVACPCALALAAPFALGNMLRIFGYHKLYLKNANIIEDLSRIETIIFDKTGTITTNKTQISFEGTPITQDEKNLIQSVLRASNHPLSRMLYKHLGVTTKKEVLKFKEVFGKGLQGVVEKIEIKIGSEEYVKGSITDNFQTAIFVKINGLVKGKYIFENNYRDGIQNVFKKLSKDYSLGVLSGDNEGEKEYLGRILPTNTSLIFDKKPEDKLKYIEQQQEHGKKVLMIGDGLNDAGALAQSNVGIEVSENTNVFSPACDGILDANKISKLPDFIKLSKGTMKIIRISFILSFLYNIIGMLFAVTGKLSPIVAAILMPISSITIVLFVTMATNYIARKNKID